MTTTLDRPATGWRVVDIVVSAAIAVAFGVVFLAWNVIYSSTGFLFAALPPAQAILYGVWLLPAVLVALVVRLPGAAFLGGFLAAVVSLLLGSPYGADALISGAAQGGAAELAFLAVGYRRWTLPVAVVAGALAGVAATVHDIIVWFPQTGAGFWTVYGVAATLSGAVVAGLGGWLLFRSLAAAGVLGAFASGREQREV